jgi:formamidopyrimidine-DNA glycosylase
VFFSQYGPEPFSEEFSAEYLAKIFANKKISIKKILMDQSKIAGVGNIYADEILWGEGFTPLLMGR